MLLETRTICRKTQCDQYVTEIFFLINRKAQNFRNQFSNILILRYFAGLTLLQNKYFNHARNSIILTS